MIGAITYTEIQKPLGNTACQASLKTSPKIANSTINSTHENIKPTETEIKVTAKVNVIMPIGIAKIK